MKIKIGTTLDAERYTIAVWQERGTKNIPSRPAFQIGVRNANNDKSAIAKLLRELQRTLSVDQFFKNYADLFASHVRKVIYARNILIGNSLSTIERKGFDWPLVDQRDFINSIEAEVES